ncbi:hypothetical protein CRE_26768 [Caenorhabditis remanei]|uniref:EGF-like domain-containing protein n=1 Tax=Caenorhabditis remanei TaxID=31234 RepID=E3NDN7_CAERE|nr:hypothetical protein CRE_26768 [Caenorhabditis remanei]
MSRVAAFLCDAACSFHGFCMQMLESFQCVCDEGWVGEICEQMAETAASPLVNTTVSAPVVTTVASSSGAWTIFLVVGFGFVVLVLLLLLCLFLTRRQDQLMDDSLC